jgi:hypothetical protein
VTPAAERKKQRANRYVVRVVQHAYAVAMERHIAHGGTEEDFWARPWEKCARDVLAEMKEAAEETPP